MQIRPATIDDARGMATVQVQSWRAAYAGIVPQPHLDAMSIDERTAVCARYLAGKGIAFLGSDVAVLDGPGQDEAVVGFISWSVAGDADSAPDTAEVASFYVAPTAWRTGAGRGLLRPGVERLRSEGFRRATLWVLADNERARRFYEATGWSADGTSKVEKIGGKELEEVRYALRFA